MIAADHSPLISNRRRNTMGYDIDNLGMHLLMLQTLFLCRTYNSIGQGMWEMFFQTGSDAKHFILFIAFHCNNLLYGRRCLGQRTRFIKYYGICGSNILQIFTTLDGDPMLACLTHG